MDPDPASTNLLWQLLLLFLLILCNAFFACSEIAIVTLNDNKLRKMAESGHKQAKKVLKLTENSSNFLATIQIGVTLAGFLTSAVAAQSMSAPFANWLVRTFPALLPYQGFVNSVSLVVITMVMSYFSLVLGELVPKRIAMQKAEPVAFGVIGILRAFSVIAKPFVAFLSVSTNLIVRLFGIDPQHYDEMVTEEEIRMMVDVGEEKGVIEESQKEMIDNIFEFDDITAEDIMTPRPEVYALEVSEPISEALVISVDEGYSRVPVYEEDIDHPIGVLHIKDLLPYVGKLIPDHLTLRDFIRPTYFVPLTKRCRDLFAEMTEKHIQLAIVIDEYGGFAGIVTMEDLLESIVGNIQDEYDHEEDEVTRIDENSMEVDGSIDIEELGELLNITFPEGEYDTLGGFLMDQLGRIPGENETPQVEFENILFTVVKMDQRRIETVHIEVTPAQDGAQASPSTS